MNISILTSLNFFTWLFQGFVVFTVILNMIRKWIVRTTPFVILSLICTVVLLYELIIERDGPAEWRDSLLFKLLFFLVAIILTDVVLKYFIKTRNYWIWIIEAFLCLGFIYYWIVI